MNTSALSSMISRTGQRGLQVGIGFALLALVGLFLNRTAFFQAYLIGYLFWLSIALGSLATLMIHHLAGGTWLCLIRRPMEAAIRTLPLLALLFIPLVIGLADLFPWANPEVVAASKYVQQKVLYLNSVAFIIRAVLYFAIWAGLGYWLTRWSYQQDATGNAMLNLSMRKLSGIGLVLYGLAATFASFDWIMSLDPLWFSSIYGPTFMVGHGLTALAFLLIVLIALARHEPLAAVATQDRYHDLGKWFFALVVLWAYMMFSQFIIIWSGNLPEHIVWYLRRTGTDWKVLAMILTLFHFAVPFLVLISRLTKRKSAVLLKIAIGILVMRLFDLFWLIAPEIYDGVFTVHWLNLVVPVALGGIWLHRFCRELAAQSVLVKHDPRFTDLVGESKHDA
jgi:hypothetical protein